MDEVFVKIHGALHYLWRAVDQDGDELDILVQKRRNKKAAKTEIMSSVDHSTQQYENNRCELSHQPSRQQERQMRLFKSHGQAQRFLSCHGIVNNLLRLGRHLLRATNYRILRDRAFSEWERASCLQNMA